MTPSETPADRPEPCPVCAAPMAPDAERCSSCGATRGAQHKCPFCGVIAQPQPDPSMRFVCPACGAPRVPAVKDLALSPSITNHLSTARSARSSRTAWRVAAGVTGAFGALAALVLVGVALIASPSLVPLLAAAVVTAMPFVFAALALRNAAQRNDQAQQALEDAWMQAAKDLATAKGSLHTAELAEAFGVAEHDARDLIAKLGADTDVSTEVTDEGELALSVRVPERLRVAVPADAVPADAEPEAEAHETVEVEAGQDDAASSKQVAR